MINKAQRTTIGALVVIDVHAKDIIQEFGVNGIKDEIAIPACHHLIY